MIEALNRDLPFDQFAIEQIAGDMLPNATVEQKIATGFHRDPAEQHIPAVIAFAADRHGAAESVPPQTADWKPESPVRYNPSMQGKKSVSVELTMIEYSLIMGALNACAQMKSPVGIMIPDSEAPEAKEYTANPWNEADRMKALWEKLKPLAGEFNPALLPRDEQLRRWQAEQPGRVANLDVQTSKIPNF